MQALLAYAGRIPPERSLGWRGPRRAPRNVWTRRRSVRERAYAFRPTRLVTRLPESHLHDEACPSGRVVSIQTAGAEMSLMLMSSAFADGHRIPTHYTCDGGDVSPPLTWFGAPEGTRSFALVCDDPDAPLGVWHHWAVYDIDPGVFALEEGFLPDAHAGEIRQARNDFGHTGYGGPRPPHGHGTHHYRFTLFALDVDRLVLEDGAHERDVIKAARAHALAHATLIGTYSR